LKLFNKKGAVTRIHLEYRGGGGYQFFLEKWDCLLEFLAGRQKIAISS
jgi:hypothetical protein